MGHTDLAPLDRKHLGGFLLAHDPALHKRNYLDRKILLPNYFNWVAQSTAEALEVDFHHISVIEFDALSKA